VLYQFLCTQNNTGCLELFKTAQIVLETRHSARIIDDDTVEESAKPLKKNSKIERVY
jgi:hypothetical protein